VSEYERTIFVFGSNREGRHGKGAALSAVHEHGAVYGQAEGLQGDSYAIVTKELRRNKPPVTLPEIKTGVERFLQFAESKPNWRFDVTPIGCGLAGFQPSEIAPMFAGAPENVRLPSCFESEARQCGKSGCKNTGIVQGYVGCLKVWSCREHAGEVEGVLGGPVKLPLESEAQDE